LCFAVVVAVVVSDGDQKLGKRERGKKREKKRVKGK